MYNNTGTITSKKDIGSLSVDIYMEAYLDIETTGLNMWGFEITTISLYDGESIFYYVNGQNLEDFEKDIRNSESFLKLKQTDDELSRTNRKLHEEISVIWLRRIVPGKCKFCPL